jgi:hypothetical protein
MVLADPELAKAVYMTVLAGISSNMLRFSRLTRKA